jgi:hypothetical protein
MLTHIQNIQGSHSVVKGGEQAQTRRVTKVLAHIQNRQGSYSVVKGEG